MNPITEDSKPTVIQKVVIDQVFLKSFCDCRYGLNTATNQVNRMFNAVPCSNWSGERYNPRNIC